LRAAKYTDLRLLVTVITMGIIKKLTVGSGVLSGGVLGYLGLATTIISPLPQDDPLWRSKSYAKYNAHQNSSTQDICLKRIPLSKIRPDLLQNEGDLALEFCRGVWGGLGETHATLS
jgi:hypothetical protein